MTNFEKEIDNIILLPAAWNASDYIKAKKQLISLHQAEVRDRLERLKMDVKRCGTHNSLAVIEDLKDYILTYYIRKSDVLEAIDEGRFIDPNISSGENISQFRSDLIAKLGLEKRDE